MTRLATEREVDPRALGVAPAAVARIWDAVERLYRSGMHPAIAVCVRCRGGVLLDRAIGHASGNGPDDPPDAPKRVVTPDTPFTTLSASKPVAAMMIHLLAERGLLHLDDPVAEYIPEFAQHRKHGITIRHLLVHRAGLAFLPPEVLELDRLADPARVLETICDIRPVFRPGRTLAYHALSSGFIMAELVRRLLGKDIRAFVDEVLCWPLGLRWMNFGVAPADVGLVARNYFTGPPIPAVARALFRRVLGVDFEQVPPMSNDPRFLTGIIPSANLVATANEMSIFYQLLLEGGALGGVRVFDARTVYRATHEQTYMEFDRALGLPIRYSLGFMLGARWLSLYGPGTGRAFGHLGFTNVITWADPRRRVAAAILTSGKPLLYPGLYDLIDIPRQIGLACPPIT
ncbi:MAG TPA: serine hydrolase domain-containing protein [Candidatus Limnocylindria bacterium]|nr:serine hydrolase domain-containing protein [Candidatus Limnocylindria bacterium]